MFVIILSAERLVDAFALSAFYKLLVVNLDDLFVTIVTAVLANSVSKLCLLALGAFYDAGYGNLPMCGSALISSCF